MDTIDTRKTDEWKENLERVLDGRTPDYLVVSHLEPDHAGSIKEFADKYPEAKIDQYLCIFAGFWLSVHQYYCFVLHFLSSIATSFIVDITIIEFLD